MGIASDWGAAENSIKEGSQGGEQKDGGCQAGGAPSQAA